MSGEHRPPSGKPGEPVAAPAGGDPSMEDILASIRRILNEEETAPAEEPMPEAATVRPAAAPSAPPEPEADDALALSEDMLVSEPVTPPVPIPPPAPEPVIAAAPAPPAAAPAPPEPAAPTIPAEALLAPAAAAAATASLGTLLRTVAAERSSAVSRGGPTIEDVVREEIRPMLKEWLDQHLPPLVERLVRAEIERVVGRALS